MLARTFLFPFHAQFSFLEREVPSFFASFLKDCGNAQLAVKEIDSVTS